MIPQPSAGLVAGEEPSPVGTIPAQREHRIPGATYRIVIQGELLALRGGHIATLRHGAHVFHIADDDPTVLWELVGTLPQEIDDEADARRFASGEGATAGPDVP